MTPNIVQTEDGSITCIDAHSGELYHNRIGAYTEALNHYVKVCDLPALLSKQSSLTVLDVCFGLGYNSFVLIDQLLQLIENNASIKSPISCHIIGIDRDKEIFDLIPKVLLDPRFDRLCKSLNINTELTKDMVAQWQTNGKYKFQLNNKTEISILLEMKIADLRQEIPKLAKQTERFDYIFHDGFSPRSMPELWTVDLFKQYANLIIDSGRIITYSSAYAVRGAFIECGLEVRKSAPLGGKSGGTVAFKKGQPEIADGKSILSLSNEEQDRLKSASGIPYRDPDFCSTSKQIVDRRQLEIMQAATSR